MKITINVNGCGKEAGNTDVVLDAVVAASNVFSEANEEKTREIAEVFNIDNPPDVLANYISDEWLPTWINDSVCEYEVHVRME